MPEFRERNTQTVSIESGGTQSEVIDTGVLAFGCVIYPPALDGTLIYIEVLDKDSNWHRFADSAGEDLELTFYADKGVRLPDEVFAAGKLRLVTATTQTAERSFEVQIKS